MNGREKLPDWEQIWSDLVQEEFRQKTKDGSSSKSNDEEYFSLSDKANKAKGKKSRGEVGKKDLSKIRCFHYHEHGHYATNFPQKKARKKEPAVVAGEALDSQFELDFNLIECMSNSIIGYMWYLDNVASFHMTGNRYLFNDLEEKNL